MGEAAAATGWSSRMLRYLEEHSLVVPRRAASGYRLYGLAEINRLQGLRRLRDEFAVDLTELAFAARLRSEPQLRQAVDAWLAAGADEASWVAWEQRKHERLLVA